MKNLPLVSICSITYNHAPFIRQCLEGFLMQQTNFPIEIIINDDCSIDGTTEIIREYAEKYPDKIFPIFHEENLYSQGIRGMFQRFVFPKARGKYIAICEGDDYWTDPYKLQKQVDFLEMHPDYSMCFHKAKIVVQDGRKYDDPFSRLEEREYFPEEILIPWIIPTASIMMRTSIRVPFHKDFRTGDVVIHAACVEKGRVYCMKEEMSIYRLHGTGWSAIQHNPTYILSSLVPHYLAMIQCFNENVAKHYKPSASICCLLWLRKILTYRNRISLFYLFKSLYYCNWSLLCCFVRMLLKKYRTSLKKLRNE